MFWSSKVGKFGNNLGKTGIISTNFRELDLHKDKNLQNWPRNSREFRKKKDMTKRTSVIELAKSQSKSIQRNVHLSNFFL